MSLRTPVPSAATVAGYWSQGMSAAGAKYTAGINAFAQGGVAPGTLAAAQVGKYVAGVTKQQNVWATNVAAVTLQAWQKLALALGPQGLAAAGQNRKQNYQNAMTNVLSHMQGLKTVLLAMPQGKGAAGTQRMIAWKEGLEAIGRRGITG